MGLLYPMICTIYTHAKSGYILILRQEYISYPSLTLIFYNGNFAWYGGEGELQDKGGEEHTQVRERDKVLQG